MASATLYVCTTCRSGLPADPEAPRPGAVLHAALAGADLPEGVTVKGVECLSACNTGCAIALSAPGKWTYVYGHLDPAAHLAPILDGAARYAASADGLVPWRERPEIFRKQSLARVPPFEIPVETTDV
ncbi:DUF1636 domain-containing protein [Gemmobacter fulvus]|uniref:DUF1636 domain-containing protein n=1 Tax=Gemmobacter fulvus TaxID=2840474 RepID=A0A975P8G9_9RHOB|nr:DUF1636 domain-containing protein [Gemmobacter fulvus]MBT9244033.1 DUF1636 domain-containing protein [Gemmobacter fulvus]MDQ1849245.1 DUF1636 domain-containing protein [Gemmobacter fulvus]QWK90943.1 DUF1636 domain-containing protein [Gemmobacter fulvus]